MGTLTRHKRTLISLSVAGLLACTPISGFAASSHTQATPYSDYLMAQAAEHDGNWNKAATLLTHVWQQNQDPDTLRQAFVFALGSGDFATSLSLAAHIQPGSAEFPLAAALQAAQHIKQGNLVQAKHQVEDLPMHGISVPLSALLNAWLLAGSHQPGNMPAIMDSLGGVGEFETVKALHTALIAEAMDKKAEVDIMYQALAEAKPTPRIAVFVHNYYARTQRPAAAAKMIATLVASDPEDVAILSVAASPKLAALRPTIRRGAAEAYYDMAELLLNAEHPDIALLYAQIGFYLEPDLADNHFLLGNIKHAEGRYQEAVKDFNAVPETSGFRLLAKLDAIASLEHGGAGETALKAAATLVETYPGLQEPKIAFADLLRRREHYTQAIALYSQSLAKLPAHDTRRATLLFARGVAYDRAKQSENAETDLKQAVALAPNDPLILNYLGFLWADQGRNLTEARALLEHAFQLGSNDPAIADSLGWVLYRLGEYDAAIEKLELAVQANPGDSLINAHLGDAYWRVGYKIEAEYQWQRALQTAERGTIPTLKDKLRDGLPETPPMSGENHAALTVPRLLGN